MNEASIQNLFEKTFDEMSDAIYRFAYLKVSNVELAEDITQEVFMRYFQYLKQRKKMTNTRSFLYTVAHNLIKDWYKKKKPISLNVLEEAGYEAQSNESDPLTFAHYAHVLRKLEALDEIDREVLILRYVEGLEIRDIADIVGESANVISVRIHRAKKRLQKEMEI